MRLLENSNLPCARVTLCAVGTQSVHILAALENSGISTVRLYPIAELQTPVASHADLRICHLGGTHVLISPHDFALRDTLVRYGFCPTFSAPLSAAYPADVRLNCALVGGYCFAAPAYLDHAILSHCAAHKITVVPVKQGYTKCSVCIAGERALITADTSIASAARSLGFDVLLIQSGHIRLDGYDTGFIGGCTGLLAPRLLAFTGTLFAHPDGERIARFLAAHAVDYIELTDEPLLDVGSILPLGEE